MTLSRSFKVALLISAMTHVGVFAFLDREPVAEKLLAPPKALVAKRPEPRVIRFELVDTPASAETAEPPKNSSLVSNKNTRAQDRFKSDKKLKDSPHLEGKSKESKDTRPRAVVAKSSPPARPTPKPAQPVPPPAKPKPAQPKPEPEPKARPEPKPDPAKEVKDTKAKEPVHKELAKREKEPLQQVLPRGKPVKPVERARIAPEPKEKEVIRLAKKAPAQARPTPPAFPRIGAGVSAANMGGDATITGEISFGATRHFFGDYLLKMKQAVETEWMSSLVSQYSGIERSTAAIDFKIQPDGRVTDMEITSNDGDPYFPLVCISSIQSAQPFDEIRYSEIRGLPEEFIDKPLSVQFTFRYN